MANGPGFTPQLLSGPAGLALHATSGVDTGGLVAGTLDYTKAGQPPSRTVYICQVDAGVPGGLKAIGGPVEAEPAKTDPPGA